MYFLDFLTLQEPTFAASKAKVHLARHNKIEAPMDVYLQGRFDEWQRWQIQRNFEREWVVSLVQDKVVNTRWLFAGLFRSEGYVHHPAPDPHFMYNLIRVPSTVEFEGRLFLRSRYKERQTYVYGETVAQDLTLEQLLPERLSIGQFPGFKRVNLSKAELDLIVLHNLESWRTALSAVKGVYLITDTKTGKLYVGKADGEYGIWGRWCSYAANGHGHNKALVKELGIAVERQQDFRFTLLEIADLHSMPQEIDARESHWKAVLMTRTFGYNLN